MKKPNRESTKVKMRIILSVISLVIAQTVEKDADYEAELAAFEAEIAEVEARELAEFLGLTTLRYDIKSIYCIIINNLLSINLFSVRLKKK